MRLRHRSGERKKICSKCNNPLEESRVNKQRYCKSCHAKQMRDTRPKHSQLSDLSKKKANCRSYTNTYIKRGKILVMPCWICGSNAEAHHEDYNNPKDIIWLCREHHLELHSMQKKS